MAINRQNKLTPILVITALCVVGFVLYKVFTKGETTAQTTPMTTPPIPNVAQSAEKGGKNADADSPTETIKTLTSEVKELKQATQQLNDENNKLRNQNTQLQANEDAVVERVRSSLRDELSREFNTTANRAGQSVSTDTASSVVDTMLNGTDSVKTLGKAVSPVESGIPHGLGYETKPGGTLPTSSSNTEKRNATGRYQTISPVGMKVVEGASGQKGLVKAQATTAAPPTGPVNSWLATGEAPQGTASANGLEENGDASGQQKGVKPYFTIPENATLANVTAMSAIVGRVPVDGRVQDPMQFKLLIGRENLAANGQDIPDDIAGIVVSGIGIGDMTLSCSEGLIQSLTFIFNDGSIRTVSRRTDGAMQANAGSSAGKPSIATTSKLGYISDAYGNPCIAGKFVTNAPSYLTDVVGLKSLTVGAASLAASQTTTIGTGLGTSTGVTGDKGTYSLGQAVGGAADEVTSWIMRRMNNSFDAVVTPAGARVVVHIDQEISIDKALNGRKLNYGNINGAASSTSRKRTTRYGLD